MLEYLKFLSILATVYACLFWALAMLFKLFVDIRTNKIYVLILFAISTVVYLLILAKFRGHYSIYAMFFPVQSLFVLSLFPLFYLYVHTLTRQVKVFKPKYLLHFIIPAAIAITFYYLLHMQMNKEELNLFIRRILLEEEAEGVKIERARLLYSFGKVLYVLMSVVYTILIYRDYKKHIFRSSDLFSNEEVADIRWVKIIVVLYLLMFVFHLTIQILSSSYLFSQDLLVFVSYGIFALFFFALGYFSFSQNSLYYSFVKEFEEKEGKNFRVTADEIKDYMIKEKPYLNKDYSLYDFCIYFNSNRTYLSELINKEFDMNFRSFINTYRLAEAKFLFHNEIKKDINVSFEYIALKSGFNSFTSFKRAFKQLEGITPVEYRKIIAKKINNTGIIQG